MLFLILKKNIPFEGAEDGLAEVDLAPPSPSNLITISIFGIPPFLFPPFWLPGFFGFAGMQQAGSGSFGLQQAGGFGGGHGGGQGGGQGFGQLDILFYFLSLNLSYFTERY